ncbi:MAG: MBL fold metallo-hydrolase [Clostridia bacterium]|nr:MBL fold metallo-hydrolase [Clostridia bacterium]
MQIKKFVIGMIENNDYLVWDENTNAAALIDATDNKKEIVDEVIRLGLNLQYIILTHGHFDHTTGTKFYQNAFPKAKLVACKKEAKMLYERALSHGPGGIVADIWIKDNDELELGDITLKFIETPGHSKGGMCILAEDVLFSGDTLFQCSVGRTDLPTGDGEELMQSLNKLFALPDDTRVLPGHGAETSIGFEKRYNPFV